MVLVQRYSENCGVVSVAPEPVCVACGASLKITLPLDDEGNALFPEMRLLEPLPANHLLANRYRIVRRVGGGGFGSVYEAQDTRENRRVAIKEIGLSGLAPQQVIEATGSFNREVELLSSLKHPGIPSLYEHMTDSEHWYLVMEFIAGETLEERLARTADGRLPLEQALQIGSQVCDILEYLHSRQPAIVFRDLKPANIMLQPDQRVYVIDFGVARRYTPGKPKDTIAFGSPGYAAPEQYGRAQTGPRSDIYSLGALLHQVLTGQDPSLNPFRFQPLRVYDRALPTELERLVAQMLETDMERRPASADEVRCRIQAITASRIVTRRRKVATTGWTTRPQPPLASAAELARAFSTVGVTVYIYRGHGAAVNALAWAPDGRMIVSSDDQRISSFWYPFRPSPLLILPAANGHSRTVNDLAWSPDGHILATASDDHTVRLWRVGTQPHRWQLLAFALGFGSSTYEGHQTSVNALSWSPNGTMLASAEEKSAVHVWDARTRKRLLTFHGHRDVVEDVAWAPDRLRIASSSIDHTVRVWSAANGKSLWRWRAKGGTIVHTLAWSPDARYLACGTSSGQVHVWDLLQERQVLIYRGHKEAVSCVDWSPDSQRIVSASFDGTVHLWRALDGKEAFIYRSHEDSVLSAAWSPDGQHIASADREGAVHVWKTV